MAVLYYIHILFAPSGAYRIRIEVNIFKIYFSVSYSWPALLQRLHINEEFPYPDPIAVLRSLLSHWGSSPPEIRIGFPALPLHLYSAALPSIVFSSIRCDPLPIHFLDPQPTNLVGLEAMNIDEEGDWDEASSSESEESDSLESGEESTVLL
ncbi:hypothetical protein B0H16DRAFT_1737512 [Mycena metata]|uniref:Uncharacterized protein n=1 Tax=Mycena metata TaxID=1033252 RepID=A0AAD7MLX8_9AGAR|nr:hypothetical protein B0H16DRAFT_1737512 [Mycena metata]